MNLSTCIAALATTALPLVAAESLKLSGRPEQGELQRTFRAARDGYELLRMLLDQRVSPNLIFASFTGAGQSHPPYAANDPKYNTDPPQRPQRTSLTIRVSAVGEHPDLKVPDRIQWDELIPYNGWQGRSYTAYQALTEAGFDPFAHNGKVAFYFDASKEGRSQFDEVRIVPDDWDSQIDASANWRTENKALFERVSLAKDDFAMLRRNAASSNPLIKKMAASLLMKHKTANSEDMKAWLKSEPSLVDVAVTVQMLLADDPKSEVMTSPAWMMDHGERVWGGALIGAALLFTQNQKAVSSMMLYHAKLREAGQVQSDEIGALKQVAMDQVGFDTLHGISAELARTHELRHYPAFSTASQVMAATNIMDRSRLLFEPPKQ